MSTECNSCYQKIDSRAKRCIHCGAAWGRLHNISVVSSVVGLVLSVISLVALAYTGGIKLFEKEKGELVGEFLDVRKDGIHFAVTNTGNRAVTLFDVWVMYPINNETCKRQFMGGSREIDKGIVKVIEPKKTESLLSKDKSLYHKIPSSFVPEFRANSDKYGALEKKCSIELSYVDYDQKTKQKTIRFPCNPQGACIDDLTRLSN
jgi:hypothetical protein